jgi:hypothetical protein
MPLSELLPPHPKPTVPYLSYSQEGKTNGSFRHIGSMSLELMLL